MTMTDYKKGQREFKRWLTGYGIQLAKVEDLGLQNEDGWDHFAWSLTVNNRYAMYNAPSEASYSFPFKQGTGHTQKPTLEDLMSSLLRDAETVLERDFEDWASDLGYDSDSRAAEKIYQQILADNTKLAKLFRTTDLAGLLEKAEPLLEAAGL